MAIFGVPFGLVAMVVANVLADAGYIAPGIAFAVVGVLVATGTTAVGAVRGER